MITSNVPYNLSLANILHNGWAQSMMILLNFILHPILIEIIISELLCITTYGDFYDEGISIFIKKIKIKTFLNLVLVDACGQKMTAYEIFSLLFLCSSFLSWFLSFRQLATYKSQTQNWSTWVISIALANAKDVTNIVKSYGHDK